MLLAAGLCPDLLGSLNTPQTPSRSKRGEDMEGKGEGLREGKDKEKLRGKGKEKKRW